jgi:transporter family-2 protein
MNTTFLLLAVMALVSGALIPVQAATNAALSRSIGGNVPFAAMVLFVVGTLATGLTVLVAGKWPALNDLREAPWWSYTGGLIVAFYVLTITFLAPRLGVGAAIALIVTGQVIAAVTIDQFGLMRSLTVPLSPTRMLGATLMIIGVFLALKR